eukprot:7190393-Pyramimonas_sp.AAC.1
MTDHHEGVLLASSAQPPLPHPLPPRRPELEGPASSDPSARPRDQLRGLRLFPRPALARASPSGSR